MCVPPRRLTFPRDLGVAAIPCSPLLMYFKAPHPPFLPFQSVEGRALAGSHGRENPIPGIASAAQHLNAVCIFIR